MLETRKLSVSYGQHRALEDASICVDTREVVAILGANGAGKSTLLKAICGICEGRVSGEVLMDGAVISGWPSNRIVEQGIALVPEGRGIFPELSVQENLSLGAYSARARENEAGNLDRIFQLFPKLRERRRQVVRTMSGGEQQMVAIGRAMMSNPKILALDEPSLGLSPLLCRELFQSLTLVRDAGVGILLVEQNAKQSLAIADRGYLLENATIVREDTAKALIGDPAVQKAYLGAAGAAAPVTVSARSVTPASNTRPAPHDAAPRAHQTSPTEIAAAAMKDYSTRNREREIETRRSRETTRPEAPRTDAHAPKPVMAPMSPSAERSHGIDIDRLVASARAKSAETTRRRTNGSGAAGDSVAAGPTRTTTPPLPVLGDSADRLRAVLREIEEAAARARNYRPPGQNR